MPAPEFVEKLNQQVGHEFAASQQYVAVAAYYDGQTFPRLAAFYYRQALEERNHAMMMIQYLLDAGVEARIPGVEAPRTSFADIVEPVQLTLDQEREVAEHISALARVAREHEDYASEQFMQWFIKEQVEEISSMAHLLAIVQRAREDPLRVEEHLARETVGDGGRLDPTAPPAAGGVL
jgi:ferritin